MQELIDRIHKEHAEYLEHIKQLPPEEIIRQAYEICYREEFIIILETKVFDDDTLAVLLKTPNVIDILYDEWLKTDASISETLIEVIHAFVEEESE